jgi:hypothetical protein
MTRGVVAICSLLMTAGIWAGQDSTPRVLTSHDIEAEIGSDKDTRSVVGLVLSHLLVNHQRREFFLASQFRTEWLPPVPGVEFVRLPDAEIGGHISVCGTYWLVNKVERVDNVVSIMLTKMCAATTRGYIVSFEGGEWRPGPPGTGKDGGSWVPGIGSGILGGPPPGCRCQ